ncbi:MAG: glucose-6-phosphate isomerase [Gemmataceae bacterium]|nr:glucose-6-phosphate isomerase [Gemmataceae bacterium]MDW8266126.1 glucose-6-phosphate isomerase [Gemmataceae bacterium]
MQLPDEAVSYEYQSLLIPSHEEWNAVAELRAKHYLAAARLKALVPQLMQVKSQVAIERELQQVPLEMQPLDSGFIDLPQRLLDMHRRRGEASELGRVLAVAQRLREQVDRVLVLGTGGSTLGAQALFQALCHTHHNELPLKARLGVPRVYFKGDNLDTDALQELVDLLEATCVDSELRDERWGIIVISKSGDSLETSVAFRVFYKEAAKFYGARSDLLHRLIVPITGENSRLRNLARAIRVAEEDILTIPERVGSRFSVFTPAGLLPAAVMGLDVRALLLGAAAMTRRFLEEPFDRNPVLQFAAVNYLMTEELGKSIRVLAVWSSKLEALGRWYAQLVAESLGKHGRGPTPLTLVQTRDLHTHGQLLQEGARDKVINNLVLRTPRTPPLAISMSDYNQDELNALNRKTLPDLLSAALRGANTAYADVARPTADLVLPTLSEHTIGQLMQMLMLASVIEGRLMGVNPYSQSGGEVYRRNMRAILKT